MSEKCGTTFLELAVRCCKSSWRFYFIVNISSPWWLRLHGNARTPEIKPWFYLELSGPYASLSTIFLVDYLGLERLTNSFGLLSMVKGLSTIAGAPIAGNSFGLLSMIKGLSTILGAPIAGDSSKLLSMMKGLSTIAGAPIAGDQFWVVIHGEGPFYNSWISYSR